jgi:hypothetical protein
MLRVLKYGTGHPIPEGAIYLCTKTETVTKPGSFEGVSHCTFKRNVLVWHYFLVEDNTNNKNTKVLPPRPNPGD